jgi:hypothetical protein
MSFTRHFFIGNQYLGSGEDRLRFIHGEAQQPWPYVVFCSECGEIWARMPVDGSEREWGVLGRHCEAHSHFSREVPGSLIADWEPEFFKSFSREMIEREFKLHMNYWERQNGQRG